MKELTHHGADDELSGLACGGQARAEAFSPVGMVKSRHRRHREGFTQESLPDLGQTRLPAYAAPGFLLTRIPTRKGNGLSRVIKALWRDGESQPYRDGSLAHTGNRL